jgi:threonine synthase
MDIQIASNFERYVYYALNENPARVREALSCFKATGRYRFENLANRGISSSRTDDAAISEVLKSVYQQFDYVADPHTACGFHQAGNGAELVLATAHPAKFPDTIEAAVGQSPTHPSLERLKERPILNYAVEPSPAAIKTFMRERLQV